MTASRQSLEVLIQAFCAKTFTVHLHFNNSVAIPYEYFTVHLHFNNSVAIPYEYSTRDVQGWLRDVPASSVGTG